RRVCGADSQRKAAKGIPPCFVLWLRAGPGAGPAQLVFQPFVSTSLNSTALPLTEFTMIPQRSSSLINAELNFFAIFSRMCGGSGGISGSVLTSSRTGRSLLASASSHAAPTSSPLSQKIPFSPSSSAYLAYGTSGRDCDPTNRGSPVKTRCSQVTWFKSSLLKTQKTNGAPLSISRGI